MGIFMHTMQILTAVRIHFLLHLVGQNPAYTMRSTLILTFVLIIQVVQATTITVTSTADAGANSLRQAVLDAMSGDTIRFDPSIDGDTIKLTSGPITIESSMAIIGDDAPTTIIYGQMSDRMFFIYNNNSASGVFTLSSLNLQNAFIAVTTDSGGGVIQVKINNSTIAKNGIGVSAGAQTNITITNCDITMNRSGLSNSLLSDMTIKNSRICGNGLSLTYGSGGISSFGDLTIINCQISGNATSGREGGGGIIVFDNPVMIINSTIAGNSSTFKAGGLSVEEYGEVTLINTIVAKNFGPQPDVTISGASTLMSSNSLIGSPDGHSIVDGIDGNKVGTSAVPLDPRFIRDVDASGLPKCSEILSLQCVSPAIDMGGADISGLNLGSSDLGGDPRVVNSVVDMGAFEAPFVDVCLAKSFSPSVIPEGGISTLTLVISNDHPSDDATNASFIDRFPLGMVLASPANASTTCSSGTLTATDGSDYVLFEDATFGAQSTCTISVDVTSSTAGTYYNSSFGLQSSLGRSGIASANLIVVPLPTFSKDFDADAIAIDSVSTLTFIINNSMSVLAASSLDFSDDLPANVIVASPANASTTCVGGTLTAADGSNTISYTGGTVQAGRTCTVQVDVTSSTVGEHVNTTGDLTSTAGNSGTATATLTVNPPPGFTKSFSPNPTIVGGVSTLTFEIDNSGSSVSLTSLDFTDNLPGGVVIATPARTSNTCTGGTLTATAGSGVITYSGGTAGAGSTCTVQVDVISGVSGSFINTTGDFTSSLGNSGTATATLTVDPPPTFTKSFASSSIPAGDLSILTFTVDNSASSFSASSLNFTDNLPPGLSIANPANASTTCMGGTLTAVAGSGVITYSGGTVAAGAVCTLQVVVTGALPGTHMNTTGDLTSSNGNSGPASDDLNIIATPPVFAKLFSPDQLLLGGLSTLTFTIDNSAVLTDVGELDFTDNLPVGLVIAPIANASITCTGGSLTALPGATMITYSGGAVAAGTACMASVDVVQAGAPLGPETSYTNTSEELTSEQGSGGTATDDLIAVVPGGAHGFLYEDVDSNGIYEEGVDWPMEGVLVNLFGMDRLGTAISASTSSDIDGFFWFTDLFGGGSASVEITIIPPVGFDPSTATMFASPIGPGEVLVSQPGIGMPGQQSQVEVVVGAALQFGINRIGGADCNPNCRDINASLDASGHLNLRLKDLLGNAISCAAGVEVIVQNDFGASVFGPRFITAGDVMDFDACSYRGRKLKEIISSDHGTCWSEISVEQNNIPVLSGESHDAWCFDSIVSDPNAYLDFIGGKSAKVPCQAEVIEAQFVADWVQFPAGDTCGNDTVKIIYREFEAFDKLGRRGSVTDTIVVFRLPHLTNESIFCLESSTIYCDDATGFLGPTAILGNNNLGSTEIQLIDLVNNNGELEFQAADLGDKCGIQVQVDQWKLSGDCEEQYKVVVDLKQSCPGGPTNVALAPGATLAVGGPPIPPNVWVPLTADYTYWRCEFWVTVLDTLAPVVNAKDSSWVSVFTSAHDCAAHVYVPSVQVIDDWSGVKQVKAVIENIGTTIMTFNGEDSCWQSNTQFKLPKSDVPYKVVYEAYDSCHNIGYDSVFIKIRDYTRPVALADKGLTVSLSTKKIWIEAETFDEGSWDNCGVNMILARRVDWTEACVDLCYNSPDSICHPDNLEEACFPVWYDAHDTIWYINLQDDKHCDEVEAHYYQLLEWWRNSGQSCRTLLYNSWQYDLMKYATVFCKGSGKVHADDFDKVLTRALQQGIDGFYFADGISPNLDRYDLHSSAVSGILDDQAVYRMAKDELERKIYFTNLSGGSIQSLNYDGSDLEQLVSIPGAQMRGIAVDASKGQIYFSTDNSIYRFDRHNNTLTLLQNINLNLVLSLVLDLKSEQLYFTNAGEGSIERMDLDGSNRTTIVDDLGFPEGLALDLSNSQIYWSDQSKSQIVRAKLDGLHREVLLQETSESLLSDLSVDLRAGQIYYTEVKDAPLYAVDRIRRMNIDGTGLETILIPESGAFGLLLCSQQLDIYDKFLFEDPHENHGSSSSANRSLSFDDPSVGLSGSQLEGVIDNWKNIGGGWSDVVPFSCEDACGPVKIEILVMDFWCNWAKAWTDVWVEDKTPANVAKDVSEEEKISCRTYKDKRYIYPDEIHPVSLDYIVEKATLGEQNALGLLDDVFGGYGKAWKDPYGNYVDLEGNEIECDITFYDSICACATYTEKVRVYDEHLGYLWKDSVITDCFYGQDTLDFQKGILVVNCEANVQCEQTVWSEFDHCGQGYLFREFKIWQSCPDSFYLDHNMPDSLHQEVDTIYRHQRIWVQNTRELNKFMFDVPYDTAVYSCNIEYDGAGNVIGAAGPENTGMATYRFDDDCRLVGIGHADKVFKVVGGSAACYKIYRTFYFADWCAAEGTPLSGAWWNDSELVVDSCVQKIIIIDTMPPICMLIGAVENGGEIAVGACTYNLQVSVDAADACSLARYHWELKEISDLENGFVVDIGDGDLEGNEDHFDIESGDLPHGTYQLHVVTVDECNNEGSCEYLFEVVSVKKPSPVCITSLTAHLTPWDSDGDGITDTARAVVWANEFDVSSSPACQDTSIEFRIEFLTGDSSDLSAAGDVDSLALGCGDEGAQMVRLWVVSSPSDTRDFCDVLLIVQSDGSACDSVVGQSEPLRERSGGKDETKTMDRSLLKGDGNTMPGVEGRNISSQNAETGFNLDQNFPNPFETQTMIGFVLPEAMEATISIYDVTGRLIRSMQGTFSKGHNDVQFKTGDLSHGGILYYRLTAGKYVATRKMMVLE